VGKLLATSIIVLIIFFMYKILVKGKFKAKYRTEDLDILLPDKKEIEENDLCPCKSGEKFKDCCRIDSFKEMVKNY
jgi:hypothetical protein